MLRCYGLNFGVDRVIEIHKGYEGSTILEVGDAPSASASLDPFMFIDRGT